MESNPKESTAVRARGIRKTDNRKANGDQKARTGWGWVFLARAREIEGVTVRARNDEEDYHGLSLLIDRLSIEGVNFAFAIQSICNIRKLFTQQSDADSLAPGGRLSVSTVEFQFDDAQTVARAEQYRRRKATAVLAVVFTDIAGSTELRERLGEYRYEDLRESHDQCVRELIEKDDAGVVVKSTGDGALAVFAEPSTAVLRCLAIQELMETHAHFKLRVGIDIGQVSLATRMALSWMFSDGTSTAQPEYSHLPNLNTYLRAFTSMTALLHG
ncbi:MAG TPA: adenylate/guanylate cyclase domain-containing protein [Candidatus Binatia bacterium]